MSFKAVLIHFLALEELKNELTDFLPSYIKVTVANVLAVSCNLAHPVDTEQQYPLIGVVFLVRLNVLKCMSSIHSLYRFLPTLEKTST